MMTEDQLGVMVKAAMSGQPFMSAEEELMIKQAFLGRMISMGRGSLLRPIYGLAGRAARGAGRLLNKVAPNMAASLRPGVKKMVEGGAEALRRGETFAREAAGNLVHGDWAGAKNALQTGRRWVGNSLNRAGQGYRMLPQGLQNGIRNGAMATAGAAAAAPVAYYAGVNSQPTA